MSDEARRQNTVKDGRLGRPSSSRARVSIGVCSFDILLQPDLRYVDLDIILSCTYVTTQFTLFGPILKDHNSVWQLIARLRALP